MPAPKKWGPKNFSLLVSSKSYNIHTWDTPLYIKTFQRICANLRRGLNISWGLRTHPFPSWRGHWITHVTHYYHDDTTMWRHYHVTTLPCDDTTMWRHYHVTTLPRHTTLPQITWCQKQMKMLSNTAPIHSRPDHWHALPCTYFWGVDIPGEWRRLPWLVSLKS